MRMTIRTLLLGLPASATGPEGTGEILDAFGACEQLSLVLLSDAGECFAWENARARGWDTVERGVRRDAGYF